MLKLVADPAGAKLVASPWCDRISLTVIAINCVVLALTFLATPFIGTAIDRLGFVPVFAAVNSLLLMVPSLLLLPRTAPLGAQLATCFVYAVGRVGQWLSYFAFVGSTFGFRHYGKLAGGGLLVQAMVSLLQYPLIRTR